ncbi:MAG TPA: FliA/WhiG family RNA polymerase sigma factor [Bacillota bacterium]|nr:FliA/WhiG family RNA polymerase sigma factor [Bacillota bacterium]
MLANQETDLKDRLWVRFKEERDIQAREELILNYSPLVKYVAGRLAIGLPANVQRDDLFSYGVFGLMEALERFDYQRGIKFETYAIARVRGAILDGLRAMDWVPYSVRQKSKQLEKTYSDMEAKLGRAATDEEMCSVLDLDMNQFHKLLLETGSTTILSLDEQVGGESSDTEGIRLLDIIQDSNALDPTAEAEYAEIKNMLGDAIDKLPERERLVIALYYYEGLTLKEIGQVLGVTESRISQMHSKAILRLRGRLSRSKKKIF